MRPGVSCGFHRPTGETRRVAGLTVPGLTNDHSHAFHRALRSHTQRGEGSFWTWREAMYRVAERLTPQAYLALARATYAEMALAGVTAVGEFHYLHHGPGGVPYADPNEMGHALIAAAADVGVRLTLLDACYLTAGAAGDPLQGPQLRFSDGDADRWADRIGKITAAEHVIVGAAVHSVRAVPPADMKKVAAWAGERRVPLHVHSSEQVAEVGLVQVASELAQARHIPRLDRLLDGRDKSRIEPAFGVSHRQVRVGLVEMGVGFGHGGHPQAPVRLHRG